MARAESHGVAEELETLLDEYYLASGVDPRRLKALTRDILDTAARHGLDKDIGITETMDEETRLARLDAHLCDLKELQIRDGLHILGESPEGDLLMDLLVALARVPRGNRPEQQSLQRAIASDLGFEKFDPLDCDFAAPWQQGRPELLANVLEAPWRSQGDTVERIELLAREIVAGNREVSGAWQSTLAVLDDLNQVLRPAVTGSGHAETSAVLTALEGGFVAPGHPVRLRAGVRMCCPLAGTSTPSMYAQCRPKPHGGSAGNPHLSLQNGTSRKKANGRNRWS